MCVCVCVCVCVFFFNVFVSLDCSPRVFGTSLSFRCLTHSVEQIDRMYSSGRRFLVCNPTQEVRNFQRSIDASDTAIDAFDRAHQVQPAELVITAKEKLLRWMRAAPDTNAPQVPDTPTALLLLLHPQLSETLLGYLPLYRCCGMQLVSNAVAESVRRFIAEEATEVFAVFFHPSGGRHGGGRAPSRTQSNQAPQPISLTKRNERAISDLQSVVPRRETIAQWKLLALIAGDCERLMDERRKPPPSAAVPRRVPIESIDAHLQLLSPPIVAFNARVEELLDADHCDEDVEGNAAEPTLHEERVEEVQVDQSDLWQHVFLCPMERCPALNIGRARIVGITRMTVSAFANVRHLVVHLPALANIALPSEFLAGQPSMEYVRISGGRPAFTALPRKFCCEMPQLRVLVLKGIWCSAITSVGIDFASGCGALETVDISGLTNVDSIGSNFLAECPRLRNVLTGNDGALRKVMKIGRNFMSSCLSLTEFDLRCLFWEDEVSTTHEEECKSMSAAMQHFRPGLTYGSGFMEDCTAYWH